MPLKTPLQISTIAEYKKLIQTDARNLTATGAKFHYFKKFTLADKTTGPVFFLGTIDSTLLGTISKKGTGLATGQASVNDNDEITLEVANGAVAYGGLSKALKSWGVTRTLFVPQGAGEDESSSEDDGSSSPKPTAPVVPPRPQRPPGGTPTTPNPTTKSGPTIGSRPSVQGTTPGRTMPTVPQTPGGNPTTSPKPGNQQGTTTPPPRPPRPQGSQPGVTPQSQTVPPGGQKPTVPNPGTSAPKPGTTPPPQMPTVPPTPKKAFEDRFKSLKPRYEKLSAVPAGSALKPIYTEMLSKAQTNDFSGALAGAGKLEVAINKLEFSAHKSGKQNRRAAKLSETSEQVKKSYFQPGSSDLIAKEKGLNAGTHFKNFLAAQKAFETARDQATLANLEKEADAYIAHFEKDFSDRDKKKPENIRKLGYCQEALNGARRYRLVLEHDKIGTPPWNEEQETRAAEVFAKMLFEQEDGKMASPNADAGVIGSWWVEKTVDDPDTGDKKLKKTFIFKPSDAEAPVLGFPQGGSAAREVMGKVISDQIQAATGLNFGTPETALITVNNASLSDENGRPGKPWPRTGSIQHFAKSEGEMRKADPEAIKSIPDEEIHKMAVLDLIQLNMDRHDGNFMIGTGEDGKKRLTPIDHGLVLPSRDGLGARRARLGKPAHALSSTPGADKKMSPEMLEKINQIDPDAVIDGMKKAYAAMMKLHPAAGGAAAVTEENYKLVKRSIEFLKKAAGQLTMAEIQDAYVVNLEKIFDTSDDKMDAGFDEAINQAKARTPLLKEADKLLAGDWNKTKADFLELGWGTEFGLDDTSWQRWVRMNPEKVVKIHQSKTENPAAKVKIQNLEAAIKKINPQFDPATVVLKSPGLSGRIDALRNAREAALMGKAKTLGVADPKIFREGPMMEAYEALGGADKLQQIDSNAKNLPLNEQIELLGKSEFERLGGEPEYKKAVANFPKNAGKTSSQKTMTLLAWQQYQQLGGDREYERLGCNEENTVIEERVKAMKSVLEIGAIN